MTAVFTVHLIAAIGALAVGAIVLSRPKGTSIHKLIGRIWVALMATTAISSFWLRDLNQDHSFSWIHILSAFVLFSLFMAIRGIRTGNLKQHKGYMIGAYCGIVGAGIGTLLPGRRVHDFIFSLF
jgi:uncharacterized membrane protein